MLRWHISCKMACFRSCFGSGAASRSVATMENPFGSASLLAVDLPPELEFTAADQEAHKANSKLAEELMVVIANKLAELGICNFWRSPSSDHAHTLYHVASPRVAGRVCFTPHHSQSRRVTPGGGTRLCHSPLLSITLCHPGWRDASVSLPTTLHRVPSPRVAGHICETRPGGGTHLRDASRHPGKQGAVENGGG